ncbi:DUF4411 family protein [Levilactobacillus namurensis]|uniref:DUF4411 family protein n=1 Tax=Levilactobacillus namurensis TaxID=380393 RepID=UPI00222F880D|nr:DUF4411 family protein [Levilactobacillus namurensis]MCW3778112.1 DUF4411 family protein [Levilactobacillus namurensis]MDT7018131.1 DUF4411 family protein [Levilactobacillus namurensis]WNN64880.1 DUF4411 family protein [Levilactobacillus namurensis]
MDYLLDSNSLIDAHKKWYRPEVFKSVWTFLATAPNVKMTTFVYDEIQYPQQLVNWTHQTFKTQQIQPDDATIQVYREIMNWISVSQRWNPAGIAQWQSPYKADPWLIATAQIHHQSIVTMDGNGHVTMPSIGVFSGKEPKIAAVAHQFGVTTIPLYELLSQLHLSL